MPIPEIDTTDWRSTVGQITFDLTTMSFNGIRAGSPFAEISRLGKPNIVDRGVLCYFELGITILTNSEVATYFYLYARDGSHGFAMDRQEHAIGSLGGPYQCFHAHFTLNNEGVGENVHVGNAAILLDLVNARETPKTNPEKYHNYEKRVSLNNESNRKLDICYDQNGVVTHLVLH